MTDPSVPPTAEPHAEASAVAATTPTPTPGTQLGGRIVRRAGTFPYSGLRFVMYRTSARHQIAAHTLATVLAVAERGADAQPAGMVVGLHLIASALGVERVAGSGSYEPVSYDQLLDFDSDDIEALGDEPARPVPPSPT